MHARIGALVCLLLVGALAAPANDNSPGSGEVLVYLRGQPDSSPSMIATMQQETKSLLLSAGFRVRWAGPPAQPEAAGGLLVVVDLAGTCSSDPELWRDVELSSRTLAFTPVEDGDVLPFSTVDCDTLGQFLSPFLAELPKARRDYLYGRAMGRVLAHELYHVLAQTSEHSREGVSEAAVTVRELVGEKLGFGEEAVARLQLPMPEPTANAAGVSDAIGR